MREYMKNRRDLRRAEAKLYLGNKCFSCGSEDSLEFDHIDPTTKCFNVSSAKALDGPWARFAEELNKCQLLCTSCHLNKTAQENRLKIPWNKTAAAVHGTAVMYGRFKCRCSLCKIWKKKYRNKEVDTMGNTRSEEPI